MQTHVHPGLVFDYINPAPLNQRLLLLTKDFQVETGAWKGPALPGVNKTYIGWHGMPARDKALERELGFK